MSYTTRRSRREHPDTALAASLASGAGRLLLSLRSSTTTTDRRALGTLGDRRSHEWIRRHLHRLRRADTVLSEEAADDPRRSDAERVWIVDPLDGTREYAEGRHDWAVHVALWSAGDLVAGAVALPGRSQLLTGPRAARNPIRRTGTPRRLRLAVSRTRPPRVAEQVASLLDAALIPMGSAGYKVGAVCSGAVDGYLHDGGQYEWDSAAPVVVARAAGLHVSRLDGSPLRYNQPDPYLPDLVVCRPELWNVLRASIEEARMTTMSPVASAGETRG